MALPSVFEDHPLCGPDSSSVSLPVQNPGPPREWGPDLSIHSWPKDPIVSFSAPRRLITPLPWFPSHFSLSPSFLFWELRCSDPLSHLSTVKSGALTALIMGLLMMTALCSCSSLPSPCTLCTAASMAFPSDAHTGVGLLYPPNPSP